MAQSNHCRCGIQRQSNCLHCEKVCIFRVPQPIMNDKNKEAYVPSIVSLGPYHEDHTMDQHKHEAVKRMATRTKTSEELLVAEVEKIENDIRGHYEKERETDVETKPFSSMMTHDACFIIEFFKCAANERDQNDEITFSRIFQNKGYKNSMHSAILTDIMKLENQVPLCVLIALLTLECKSRDNAITELAAILSNSNLFKKGFPFDGDDVNSKKDSDNSINSKLETHIENSNRENDNSINSKLKTHIKKGARHLLDLYRMVIEDRLMPLNREPHSACVQINCCPAVSRDISHGKSLITPSAKNFENAGIEFKPGKIKFEKSKFRSSKLFLPEIAVKYRTEVLLRNLMAYEECQRCSWKPETPVISNYVCLLDSLIDSEKDVAVLRDSKIIRSFVGSDKVVVDMFNKLAIGITVEPPDDDTAIGATQGLEEVMREAIQHYNSKWKVLLSEFQQAHFSKPWYAVSLLAATALLVMTVIQTVYTVK